MPLAPGVRLGAYEIQGLLGTGGMGEVYRARDTRLGRDVALKILPAQLSTDPDRMGRFEQEARAAAALNHPNIVALYDVGTDDKGPYLVSELLEGETLREVLARGPLPARRAIDYAAQIARGLAAAHDKGIVHRDLKPENVFVAADGRAKILDFGLAKLTGPELPLAGATTMPTTPPPTTPGVVLGTVGYMSPEQVRGLPADHRSDIFAFGALLYEMLTGARAFHADTAAETMTAILKADPPAFAVGDFRLPVSLQRIVGRCLEKNPAARFKSADDLAFALETLSSDAQSATAIPAVPASSARGRAGWYAAATLLAVVAFGVATYLRPAPAESQLFRFAVSPPDGWHLDLATQSQPPVAVSPNGRFVVGRALNSFSQSAVWVRSLDALESRLLTGTEGASAFFWAPDSQHVAFIANGKLSKVNVASGAVTILTDVPYVLGGAWGRNDQILLGSATGLQRVSAAGGPLTQETRLASNEAAHNVPIFFPDGEHFFYTVIVGEEVRGGAPRQLYVGTLGSPERTMLFDTDQFAMPVTLAGDQLLFARGNRLMAQRFDAARTSVGGEPVMLVDRVQPVFDRPYAMVSASGNGVLAFVSEREAVLHQLAWFNRSGQKLATIGEPADYANLELSPDDTRAALAVLEPGKRARDVWLFDLTRVVRTRFTFEAGEERTAIWSPDGATVYFNSQRKASERELYAKASNGAAGDQSVFADGLSKDPMSVSPDGRFLLYRTSSKTGNDMWILPLTGDRQPRPYADTAYDENYGKFSPDGRWVAYTSDESGQPEVFVAAFPGPGGKWQISTTGGAFPRWRQDGRELYYLAADNTLMAVAVDGTSAGFQADVPQRLFNPPVLRQAGYQYAVTRDGQRFLINTDASSETIPITIISDWRALSAK